MAGWNGSGIFTKTYSWVADAANGIKIRADRHDTNDTDFLNGINNCLTKDGQNAPSGNLPMGGFKHTSIADATESNQYVAAGQIISGSLVYATSGGSANAYTLTLNPSVTSYTAGQRFTFLANHLSTGSATLNIDGLGAKDIKVEGFFDLAPYAIKTNQLITVIYDGTQFQPIELGEVTGSIKMWSSSTIIPGWLALDGTATIGNSASGADNDADVYEGLWKHLYDATDDAECAVSGGRTTRDSDWTANKTLTLPESDDASPYGIGTLLTKAFKSSGSTQETPTGTNGVTGGHGLTSSENGPHSHSFPLYNTISNSQNNVMGGQGGQYATHTTNSSGSGTPHTHPGSTFTGDVMDVVHPVFGTYFIIKV